MSLPIDHARLPKPGDTLGEKYRLECILGSGGMGVVFGATHLITHKRVAIKWLAGELGGGSLSDTAQRFVREARLAGEFQHPNIVQVYDLGESDGSFYMVMEWLVGESLAARLERVGQLDFAEACAWLIPCMHAMQRAHDLGIVHRDIKPANIFLCDATADRPALAKVLDFGVSKRVTTGADLSTFVTRTGVLIGTPHYLAPEQLRSRPVDRRSDVYGFGVLLYQTLSGQLPFAADNFADLVVEISVGTPRPLRELVPDLPVGVEHAVARAMAREPNARYQSLHELIASLAAIDPLPLTAATQPYIPAPATLRPISMAAPAGTRERTLVSVATAISLLTAAIGFILLQRTQPITDDPNTIVRPRAAPVADPPVQPTHAGAPAHAPALTDELSADALPDNNTAPQQRDHASSDELSADTRSRAGQRSDAQQRVQGTSDPLSAARARSLPGNHNDPQQRNQTPSDELSPDALRDQSASGQMSAGARTRVTSEGQPQHDGSDTAVVDAAKNAERASPTPLRAQTAKPTGPAATQTALFKPPSAQRPASATPTQPATPAAAQQPLPTPTLDAFDRPAGSQPTAAPTTAEPRPIEHNPLRMNIQ